MFLVMTLSTSQYSYNLKTECDFISSVHLPNPIMPCYSFAVENESLQQSHVKEQAQIQAQIAPNAGPFESSVHFPLKLLTPKC